MPLYIALIRVSCEEAIPVYAKNLKEARAYLKSAEEWKRDGALQEVDEDAVSVASVKRVSSVKDIPDEWQDDILCWGLDEDTTAAEALYGLPFPSYDENESEEENEAKLERWFALLDEWKCRFSIELRERRRKKPP